jgi:hypothetical protein
VVGGCSRSVCDEGYVSAELDTYLADRGVRLPRPSYRNRTPRPGEHLLKPIRQLIESVNDTLQGQLDLELHGGRSPAGVGTRIAQRLHALTAAIWHNSATGQPVTRSLTAYDHSSSSDLLVWDMSDSAMCSYRPGVGRYGHIGQGRCRGPPLQAPGGCGAAGVPDGGAVCGADTSKVRWDSFI